jgi:hypothetical protein
MLTFVSKEVGNSRVRCKSTEIGLPLWGSSDAFMRAVLDQDNVQCNHVLPGPLVLGLLSLLAENHCQTTSIGVSSGSGATNRDILSLVDYSAFPSIVSDN